MRRQSATLDTEKTCARALCASIVLAILLVSHTSYGHALFSPTQCAPCPTMTEFDWAFNSAEFLSDPNCSGAGCPSHYINNIDHRREMFGNAYTRQMGFRIDSFDTEAYWDTLFISDISTIDSSPAIMLNGQPALGWRDLPITNSCSYQALPAGLRFNADSSVTRAGFGLGKLRVCCQGVACGGPGWEYSTTYPVTSLHRQQGVLFGDHDVIYMRDYNPSGTGLNYALWGPSTADFDIYIRCNAVPTPTSYDYRGYSSTSSEFLHIGAGYCQSGTIWIAVNSYTGAGVFNLVRSPILASQVRELLAGTDFTATPTQISSFKASLATAMKRFYGMTEGQSLMRATFFNSGPSAPCKCNGVDCDICFKSNLVWSCSGGARKVILSSFDPQGGGGPCWTDRKVIAHEFGHAFWNWYANEGDGTCATCGHSAMAGLVWAAQLNNFCTALDHGKDWHPLASTDKVSVQFKGSITSLDKGVALGGLAGPFPTAYGFVLSTLETVGPCAAFFPHDV